jgi:hypothetical protein
MHFHRSGPRTALKVQLAVGLALLAVLGGTVQGALAKPLPGASGCSIFPADNVWNQPIDSLPVRSDSATLIASIGLTRGLHPDFGSYSGYGIPYSIANHLTPRKTVKFRWKSESDKGPYPIPGKVKREAGSDHHILIVEKNACKLYELFGASKSASGKWSAGSGAIWNLKLDRLRPDGWTSADAAGLPILPGLARYDEVAAGVIAHALRFTAPTTRSAHIYPARHDAGDGDDASLPPMGLRVRLKASVDLSGFSGQAKVVLIALQRYGMILADNGSPWYVTGAPDAHWNDDNLHGLGAITGDMFEAVDTSGLLNASPAQ